MIGWIKHLVAAKVDEKFAEINERAWSKEAKVASAIKDLQWRHRDRPLTATDEELVKSVLHRILISLSPVDAIVKGSDLEEHGVVGFQISLETKSGHFIGICHSPRTKQSPALERVNHEVDKLINPEILQITIAALQRTREIVAREWSKRGETPRLTAWNVSGDLKVESTDG